jgi:ribosomal protein L11 methyltransferase
MEWRQFVMDLETLNPDSVEDVFVRHGAHSITFTDAGDKPVLEPAPGETPMWSDTLITGLFSPDANIDQLRDDLRHSLQLRKLPTNRIEALADRAWEREWLKDFGPMQFGQRLWICPGDTTADTADAIVVQLDPGLAFGTGTHPTTALCLEWLDGLSLNDATMLDYGCGSGVLAIAALKLGCQSAVAMDIDPQAIIATEQNAKHNHVHSSLRVFSHASEVDGQFDVAIANILAGPLIELAKPIAAHVRAGGRLALSGLLAEQVDDVLAAYQPWIDFDPALQRPQGNQTWACLTGSRKVH